MFKKVLSVMVVLSVLGATASRSARAGELAAASPALSAPSAETRKFAADVANYDRLTDGEKMAVLRTLRSQLDAIEARYSTVKTAEKISHSDDWARVVASIGLGGLTGYTLVTTLTAFGPVSIWPLLLTTAGMLAFDVWDETKFAEQSSLSGRAHELQGQIAKMRAEIDKKESELKSSLAEREGKKDLL